ncbi:hypothetical protein SLEP1_g26232 [Rubroshorea leprosula]|uniref:PB1-like domain-containing protein n=1 Tax=Rubroshorea leprosula TaxID=152421 RepID=A0AAV5JRV2_9ROSI|nr:hypothetical protein SLEP1_g26232 [Rubroshorea leprosula]
MSSIGELTTLITHYGGTLVRYPVVEYVGGERIENNKQDPNKLNYMDMVDEVTEKCSISIKSMCYLIPNQTNSEALIPLSSDTDVVKMAQELSRHGLVNLIGAVTKSQHNLQVLMELISLTNEPVLVPSDPLKTEYILRQKGPGNQGKKRTKTKRKQIVDFNLHVVIPINVDPGHVNTIPTDGNIDSDYFDSDDLGQCDSDNSENEILVKEDAIKRKTPWLVYEKGNLNEIPIFDLGMEFTNCEKFKDAIRTYSILKGFVLE